MLWCWNSNQQQNWKTENNHRRNSFQNTNRGFWTFIRAWKFTRWHEIVTNYHLYHVRAEVVVVNALGRQRQMTITNKWWLMFFIKLLQMSDSNWLPHPLRCVTLFTHYEMISPSICQSRIFERIKIGVIEKDCLINWNYCWDYLVPNLQKSHSYPAISFR